MPVLLKKYPIKKDELFSSMSMSKKKERLMGLLAMRVKMKRERAKFNGGECNKSVKRKRLDGHTYKKLFKIAGQKAKSSADVDERGYCLGSKSKRQRVADSVGGCSIKTKSANELLIGTTIETGECADGLERHLGQCAICMGCGELLSCCGFGCRKSFHLSCLDPPLHYASIGAWHCGSCTKKKIKYGVHSVSEGIESILDARDMVLDDAVIPQQKEYMVKYKYLAHVHNRWLPEGQLLVEAAALLPRLKRKFWTKWKAEWGVPERLLKRRQLIFGDPNCKYEWLVKWMGLNYDHATWELENSSFLTTPEAIMLIEKFNTRSEKYAVLPSSKESRSAELSEFGFEVSIEVRDLILPYVNKLREYWHKGQNAVFFDGQERVMKVSLFVLSLVGNVCRPFLIIATSSALSMWVAEFSKWSKSVDVITYKGKKDVRALIRALEFDSEEGCVTFQVLLSTPEVVAEDAQMLRHVKWEAIVIDECQRPTIITHFRKIKMLETNMKLLSVTSETVDIRQSYENILSLMDSKREEVEVDAQLETHTGTRTLKERLSPFIAFECKLSTLEFDEYWVPVRLSCMQMEQYCSLLHSNTELLSSCFKNNSSLHNILTLAQKCCDHPYLVDPNLWNTSMGDTSIDLLGAEINVSGKLQVLDKILSKIKSHALRVLVLFRSVVGSEKISIGDILDDLVDRRFGQHSYVRIQGKILSKNAREKKKEALATFNGQGNGAFVFLLDYRACHSSIRLSHVDVAILFNGDWNPLNDLRALQKISIDSHGDPLKILRLYSSFTIEEKALIFAKQGTPIDTNTRINWATCHVLLSWGASYLFSKLQSSNSGKPFVDDLVYELSMLLNKSGNTEPFKCSIVSKSQQKDGIYPRNISLLGETDTHVVEKFLVEKELIENEPHVFWTNLLKESQHRPRDLSGRPARRVQRSYRNFWLDGSESEDDLKTPPFVNKKLRSKRKTCAKVNMGLFALFSGQRAENLNANCTNDGVSVSRVPENVQSECTIREEVNCRQEAPQVKHQINEEICTAQGMSPNPDQICVGDITEPSNHSLMQPPVQPSTSSNLGIINSVREYMNYHPPETLPFTVPVFQSSSTAPLDREIERIQKDKEQATKMHQEKKLMLFAECEKEILKIRKKYDAVVQESEIFLTKQIEALERNFQVVYANKVLAEIVAQTYGNEVNPYSTRIQGSGLMRVVETPAASSITIAASHSSFVAGSRAPAPHL